MAEEEGGGGGEESGENENGGVCVHSFLRVLFKEKEKRPGNFLRGDFPRCAAFHLLCVPNFCRPVCSERPGRHASPAPHTQHTHTHTHTSPNAPPPHRPALPSAAGGGGWGVAALATPPRMPARPRPRPLTGRPPDQVDAPGVGPCIQRGQGGHQPAGPARIDLCFFCCFRFCFLSRCVVITHVLFRSSPWRQDRPGPAPPLPPGQLHM